MKFDPEAIAKAIEASVPGAGPDFLPRCAACHLMEAAGVNVFLNFRAEVVWPGRLADFQIGLTRKQHLALAAAFIALV